MTNAQFCAAFKSLAGSVLAQLILFNRRRQREVSKVLISQVTSKELEHSQDVQSSLSLLERQMLDVCTGIEIPGKRNNAVPVLLTKQLKSAVDKLVVWGFLATKYGLIFKSPVATLVISLFWSEAVFNCLLHYASALSMDCARCVYFVTSCFVFYWPFNRL